MRTELKIHKVQPVNRCRICGNSFYKNDDRVFAGYSRGLEAKEAHRECWLKGQDKTDWAFPHDCHASDELKDLAQSNFDCDREMLTVCEEELQLLVDLDDRAQELRSEIESYEEYISDCEEELDELQEKRRNLETRLAFLMDNMSPETIIAHQVPKEQMVLFDPKPYLRPCG